MFFKKNGSAESDTDKLLEIKEKLDEAEAVVIGAGAGLSTSAGFTYSGERFEQYFGDFGKKYGFSDMYSGGFYPYETLEDAVGIAELSDKMAEVYYSIPKDQRAKG